MVARLFCPWDFPGKNNWSGLPFLSSEDLPDPGIKSVSPALAGRFLSLSCLESSSFLSVQFSSVQLLSRVQLFATRWITACQASLCITNSRSSPKLMCIDRVSDAIQPSHPLSSSSPPAPNPSQHQGLFQWVNSSHEVAKVLEFQPQHQSFQWTPRIGLF